MTQSISHARITPPEIAPLYLGAIEGGVQTVLTQVAFDALFFLKQGDLTATEYAELYDIIARGTFCFTATHCEDAVGTHDTLRAFRRSVGLDCCTGNPVPTFTSDGLIRDRRFKRNAAEAADAFNLVNYEGLVRSGVIPG